ncbi:MAG: T9SS type A sorting domain-containing protein, partial [Saprospiraceae bacterium]
TFSHNLASRGGGMANLSSFPSITNTTFSHNNSGFNGGGMFNDSSDPSITNTTFSYNTASSFGGGMYNAGSDPSITNTTFSHNGADNGGGMHNNSSDPSITNTTFSHNNSGDSGGGMHNIYSSPSITNTTISYNSASLSGDGMLNIYSSSPSITNTIIWDNGSSEVVNIGIDDTPTFKNSIIKGSGGSGSWVSSYGIDSSGNLDTVPLFVNAANGDLSLQCSSPAINAGDATVTHTTDILGNPFVGMVDIGAYEFQGAGCFSVVVSNTTNVTCNAGSDGSIEVTVTGGTAPYSDGTNSYATDTFTISGLSAGPFAYTITDATGETSSISDTISEPPAITISLDNSTDVTCSGGSDGSLSIATSGGLALTYAWSSGQTTDSIGGLMAGTYIVTVSDGSSCSVVDSFVVGTVVDNMMPTVTTQDITLNLDASGNISITAADVIAASSDNCSIASSSVDITSFTDLDVGPNTVTVTVTDPSGNAATATAVVTIEYTVNTTGIEKEAVVISAYPNPAHDMVRLKMSNINEPSVLATLIDVNGKIISTQQLETQDARMDISKLPQGNYFIRIQTKNTVKTVRFVKQ